MVRTSISFDFTDVYPCAERARPRSGAPSPRTFQARDASSAIVPACPEMVVVPAGEFMMGSPESEKGRGKDEGPQHKVTFAQPFAVGKFEVTFAQWDACTAEGGCTHKPGDETWGRGQRPVINVSWDDARQFVAWLAKKTGKPYRLLTEAEWEYAARAQTKITRDERTLLHGRDHQLQAGQLRCQLHLQQRPAGRLSSEDARRGVAPQERFWPPRYARQRLGVGGGLLQGQLCRRADGRFRRHSPQIAACISCVAVPGTTTLGFCVLPTATPQLPASARKTLASGLRERCSVL